VCCRAPRIKGRAGGAGAALLARGAGAGESSSERSTTSMEGFLVGALLGVMVTLPGRSPPTEGLGLAAVRGVEEGAPAEARGWGEGLGLEARAAEAEAVARCWARRLWSDVRTCKKLVSSAKDR